ncbi:ABC transporter permease [Janthinobacterium agaricidamnosum]|uniref:ABC-2 type transporter family protein n=1 Tax=Janthinobacterium agaricidamnosum NBRC 102515 = DSM 9628 TaxID=1349767 RepID=W0V4N4_9BURK|nr:ABC transporter permease [Janthinobacterium agaricidamnosum]CDG83789.1 ABC-2 type transporter family protein [Janthinobacterium agaricidamnosum NBRC 102515 = DSM 9628]
MRHRLSTGLSREWSRLRADCWDMGMLSWIPLLLYGLIWLTFSSGIARDIPIAIIDQDQSSMSRQLIRWLDASPGIAVAEKVDSGPQALHLLRERSAYGFLLIPRGFQADLLGGRSASAQWFYNAQFSSHAGGLLRDVRSVTTTLSAGIEITARGKRGAAPVQAAQQFEPLRSKLVTLFNEHTSYESFLTLALIPSMLQIFVVVAVVTTIGRELRDGTVPQWLAAAQGSWPAAVAAKLVFPLAAFCLQALLFLLFFSVLRGWAVAGSIAALSAGLLLLVLAYLGVGLLLIGITLSLRNALSAAAFITAPAFAYAGQGFPLLAMPPLARTWAEALPLTHYLQLQSRHWLAGAPWTYGVPDLLALAGFALGCGAIGLLLLSKRGGVATAWGKT